MSTGNAATRVSCSPPSESRYISERLLGRGGLGSVYEVTDRKTGQRLALKRLRSGAHEHARPLFEREYRTLAGLRHPCIVAVHDYHVDQQGPYYTMELIEGHDLSACAPVPWRTACGYLRDTSSILGVLHAHRLLHRDIGPRNLILTACGRLKLIDFGCLAEFGVMTEIAGTPPFVPPEVMHGEPVDQRADLFALGALGYWLTTGQHAYPARTLDELPNVWLSELRPASQCLVQRLVQRGHGQLEPPPPELDELLLELLCLDPAERIQSTAELIDRLTVIAGLAPEAAELTAQGYLESKVFVGRQRERARIDAALHDAQAGRGRALWVEAAKGMGRSRFVEEAIISARVFGATTLVSPARPVHRAYGLAHALLVQLADALPGATSTRSPLGELLHLLSPDSDRRLADSPADWRTCSPPFPPLQRALFQVIAAAAQRHLLVIVVDDLHEADEASQALLTTLAHTSRLHLCIIASVCSDGPSHISRQLLRMRARSERLHLRAFSANETRVLLRSVFGEVPYLDRMNARLHRASRGNAAYYLEFAEHLVRSRTARYVEGGWVLPIELADDRLPPGRRAELQSSLDLPAAALSLARALSVPHFGCWTPTQAAAAGRIGRNEAEAQLEALSRRRVLEAHAGGYVFKQAVVRDKLYASTTATARRGVHLRVGRAMVAADRHGSVSYALAACAHLLKAQDSASAFPQLKHALLSCTRSDPAHIALHAPAFEDIYQLLVAIHPDDDYLLSGPLAMLAVAGYFADRRYALTYGERAITTLQRALHLELVDCLAPRLGRRLALYSALGVAELALSRRRERCMAAQDTMRALWLAGSALAGTAAICMDPRCLTAAKHTPPRV